MQTSRLRTILTSAYLSAMLTSGLAPIRGNAILAATFDPMAAQKSLQNAVFAMTSSGWAAPTAAASLPSAPQVVASIPLPKADPVMTDELMARLIKLAQEQTAYGSIGAKVCALFNLCDGTADLTVKQIQTENPEGTYLMMPVQPGANDIVISRKNADGTWDSYLTDKTYKLRAAAYLDASGARLIVNEKAAEKYKAALSLLAKEAADLPPTGTAVAGNS